MGTSHLIVAALSGGVDSATAAALLVAAGHRVVGVTMHLHDPGPLAATRSCCGTEHIEDARRICDTLGIPFQVIDFSAEFERTVIDDFVAGYLRGETPSPCIKCNQHLKFAALLARARALGADGVATGHYARIEAGPDGAPSLYRGADRDKDQSYFLFAIPRPDLGAIRFPLGAMTKPEVRARAAGFGLHIADKAESQEVCFIPDDDYAGFVAARAAARGLPVPGPGDIVDPSGVVLGQHAGTHHFTIGQRRGLGVAGIADPEQPGRTRPVYVTAIDFDRRRVVVGAVAQARRPILELRDPHWLIAPPDQPLPVRVQVRHRASPVAAEVVTEGERVWVRFTDTPPVAAPGQAAVFYDGDRVLGGGWIRAAVGPDQSQALHRRAAPLAGGAA